MDDAESSTTVVTTPGPTDQELQLMQQQLELGQFQLDELQLQRTAQEQFAADIAPLLDLQFEAAQAAFAEQERLGPINEELLNLALEDLRLGGAASPEQLALIQEAGDAALARGETDIERFETQGFETLREELAPSLGLRPGDTPILDRGGRLAAEGLRQRGNLSESIRGAEATATLNFPLAQSQLLQSSALGQQSLQEAIRQFQQQLSNQAVQNRLSSVNTLGGLGLGLTGVGPSNFPSISQGFSSTTSGSTGFGLTQAAELAGGIGSTALGIGALMTPSSREVKTDKRPIDDEAVLDRVTALPVETWRYRDEIDPTGKRHIGTYAEDFQRGFGLGDGKNLDLVDTTGVTFAALKALDRKIKRLERDAGFGLAA